MKRKKFRPLGFIKIVARVDINAHRRLSKIRDEYGFKSVYEIIQYLVCCFLRYADPQPEEEAIQAPLPDEIQEMFSTLSDAEKRFTPGIKPKRAINHYELNKIQGQLSIWKDEEFNNQIKH